MKMKDDDYKVRKVSNGYVVVTCADNSETIFTNAKEMGLWFKKLDYDEEMPIGVDLKVIANKLLNRAFYDYKQSIFYVGNDEKEILDLQESIEKDCVGMVVDDDRIFDKAEEKAKEVGLQGFVKDALPKPMEPYKVLFKVGYFGDPKPEMCYAIECNSGQYIASARALIPKSYIENL